MLGGPRDGGNPCNSGDWEFLGRVRGMPPNQWAIDGTVFELNHTLYFAYSGWPLTGTNGGGGACGIPCGCIPGGGGIPSGGGTGGSGPMCTC